MTVCGVTLTNTAAGNHCSAEEALCVSVRGQQVLQLARQLTAARLNCKIDTCPSPILMLLDNCDTACINNNNATDVGQCIEQIDAFNNGISPDALGCHDRQIPGFQPPGPAGSQSICGDARDNTITIFSAGQCP